MAQPPANKLAMGGIGYAMIEGKQGLVTCGASGTIKLCRDLKTDIRTVDANCPLECLAVSPLSDVVVVGDKQYVKVCNSFFCPYDY